MSALLSFLDPRPEVPAPLDAECSLMPGGTLPLQEVCCLAIMTPIMRQHLRQNPCTRMLETLD